MITALLTVLAVPFLSLQYFKHLFSAPPLVALDYASFQGTTHNGISSFLGMPYAAPPVGSLRFARPHPPLRVDRTLQAVKYGPGCPPQAITPSISVPLPPIYPKASSEDCLSVNVYKPTDIPADAKLPVVFHIHGGGFALGSTQLMDTGMELVNRSIALGHPIIYISANYRLHALGFLASKEVHQEGSVNAGLLDQRFALQWAQKYISAFGGDPDKVIVTGSSAGAVSIGLHMLAYDGHLHGLFRGAIMQSGAPFLLGSPSDAQPHYDALVTLTGCAAAADTLACLRGVPLDTLMAAVDRTPNMFGYSSLRLAWQPRTDGVMFKQEPLAALRTGRYPKLPFITGDDDDEGTLFALASLNITTNEEFLEYIRHITNVSKEQLAQIGRHYPDEQTQGSPFGTGDAWLKGPQYKRIAAFQGDWIWQAPRRYLHEVTKGTQKSWSYLFRMGKMRSFLGSMHGGSNAYLNAEPDRQDFVINFAYNLDPNAAVSGDSALPVAWPEWSSEPDGALLTFSDPDVVHVTSDGFRKEARGALSGIALALAGGRDRKGA